MISTLSLLVILVQLTTSSEEFHNEEASHNNTASGLEDPILLKKVHGNILCRMCGNEVSSSYDLISKVTPHALYSFIDSLFDKDEVLVQVVVGDFISDYPVILTSTSNCVGVEKWEEGDSWFPGYRWRPCVCPDCGEYIGWVFEHTNPDFVETPTTFFGLILSSLIGESCKYILISCQFLDCNSRRNFQLNMSATDTMSAEDKKFLASCEEEFKDRYTVNDKEFTKVFNSEPSTPPIMETWWVQPNSGRRNDRRNNRRYNPYERNNREHDRGDKRKYNDYNQDDDRGQGYRSRPRYY